jgi:enoyl-CoA hydratase
VSFPTVPHLVLERSAERVVTAWIDAPPRNWLGGALLRSLGELVRWVDREPSVGAVVLASRVPEVFVTHADLEEILRGGERLGRVVSYRQAVLARAIAAAIPSSLRPIADRTPLQGTLIVRDGGRTFERMGRSETVFIAAIGGLSLGGGCVLAMACDFRLMTTGPARIGMAEAHLGVIAGFGGTQRAVRALGTSKAIELLLDGRAMSAAEAHEFGLVHRTLTTDELIPEAVSLASRLSRVPPAVIGEVKRLVYDAGTRPLKHGLRIEAASFLTTTTRAETHALGRAYLAKLGTPDAASNNEILAAWAAARAGELPSLRAG